MTTEQAARDRSAIDRRVVVGIDGSDGARAALEWAAAEARLTRAALEIHATYDPGYEFVTSGEVRQNLQQLIDDAVEHVGLVAPDLQVTGLIHEEAPAKVLVDASRDADLLVVGSRGLGGFAGLLLGSVSQQCALHARCPVVIVRPNDDRTPVGEGS